MVLTTIFITRHGSRSNWTTDPHTGEVTGAIRSPTGIPSDPALSASGVVQARELGAQAEVLTPAIVRVYSSPFYRCLQTIEPLWRRLAAATGTAVPLIADRGLGEWFGRAPFEHHGPAALATLQRLFPGVTERTTVTPPATGESLVELHDRVATALAGLIAAVDAASTSDRPEAVVICSHAAPLIAMGRALTGAMPDDPNAADFDTYTCSISRYERRTAAVRPGRSAAGSATGETPDWRNGRGVAGGWDCTLNASVAHLSGGGERNWHFAGDESFLDTYSNGDPPARGGNDERLPKL